MITIKKMSDRMTPSLEKIKKDLETVPKQAHNFFVQKTPKQSGNARARTKLSGDEIRANYPYAKRLDTGYSKQAPRGMTTPTIDFIKRVIRGIMRK